MAWIRRRRRMSRLVGIAAIVASFIGLLSNPAHGLSLATQQKQAVAGVESDSTTLQQAMRDVHNAEVAGGMEFFGATTTTPLPQHTFENDDIFLGYSLGSTQNAGVDATCLPKHGNMVFESKQPILTKEECSLIVEEARDTILQGLKVELQHEAATKKNTDDDNSTSNQQPSSFSRTNSQLGEARLSQMPQTQAWLRETLQTRFYPLLQDRFGIQDLVLYDGLVLGNHAPTISQPIHRDASLLTLNVALSAQDDYVGGGTYIEALDTCLTINRGHLLCHAGSAMHAGNAISQGERWVLVLFLLSPHHPQLARRCHAVAIEHMRKGELDQAHVCLQAGLDSIAPHQDHLLLGTLGRLHLQQENYRAALKCFALADEAYPLCGNALASIAQLWMRLKRPRAALRRWDSLLERIGTQDLQAAAQVSQKSLAYGARRDAATCALLCADYQYRRGANSRVWVQEHLPVAIHRLQTCLNAAPNEPTLLGMLDRAEYLLNECRRE